MLTEIPASGYALCYGPLALTIVGFILFAVLGDADARRRYLRRPSLSAEGEKPAYAPVSRSAELTTQTPSGLVVQIQPDVADDLKRIEGIGPKMESVLNAAGITTFEQLAELDPMVVQQRLDEAGVKHITDPATWPAQAELAARGDWDALKALQDSLKGGRAA